MTEKILCVDDDPGMLSAFEMLSMYLERTGEDFQIETAQGGEEALRAISERGPYAVIISDMDMPGMDGIQLLHRVCEIAPETVRMMLTGKADLQVAVDAVNDGNIFRFLTKPCKPERMTKAIIAGTAQHRLMRTEKELLENTLAGSVKVLAEVLALANPVAFGRTTRIHRLVRNLQAQLPVENSWELEMSAMLSQIGCVAIPQDLLKKKHVGGILTLAEREMLSTHAKTGCDLIAKIPRLEKVSEAIAYQEKCFDGKGPPKDGKSRSAIPFSARILKVALDYDQLEISGHSKSATLEIMRNRVGRYDPAIFKALDAAIEESKNDVTKEFTVKDLMKVMEAMANQEGNDNSDSNRMALKEDVVNEFGLKILSKGQEVTIPLLQRLRNYTNNHKIPGAIRVTMF